VANTRVVPLRSMKNRWGGGILVERKESGLWRVNQDPGNEKVKEVSIYDTHLWGIGIRVFYGNSNSLQGFSLKDGCHL
jgi:hypothetical protein